MRKLLVLATLMGIAFLVHAQDSLRQQHWQIGGYVKDLQTLIHVKQPDLLIQDNLLHNRINLRWWPNDNWTVRAELRNRLFWGDQPRINPDFKAGLDLANDYFNWSIGGMDNRGLAWHMMLDRLSLEFTKGAWEISAGRQHINWGISTFWNPNDIFNAFTFTDFDYEERPGSDAVRVRYYSGVASSIELAAKMFDRPEQAVAAALFKFNRWNYDWQLLAGWAQENLVLGWGWAGNLGNAGFKGEASYFYNKKDATPNSFALTAGIDYVFSSGLFFAGGYLYNSNGGTAGSISNLFEFRLSAKNLYPYRHTMYLQASGAPHPLVTTGIALIYSPVKADAAFLSPTVTYSLRENWDLDFVGQIGLDRSGSPLQAFFLRTKWSY